MASTTIHGRGGMVYMQGSAATAIAIVQAKSFKINVDRNLDSSNKFGDQWVTQLTGLLKWTGSIDGNLDTGDTTPFDAAVLTPTATVKAYFYPDRTSTTHYYYGTIWPKLDITVDLTAVESFTQDFDGDGQLAFN